MMRAMILTWRNKAGLQTIAMVLLCCLPVHGIMGQVVTARVMPDTSQALIGDQIGLELILEKPGDVFVAFPDIDDQLTGKIVVTHRSDIDTTIISNGWERLAQRLTIAVFDTGRVEIPPLAFLYQSGAVQDTLVTLPSSIDILPLQLDLDIRDIKSNENAPLTIMEILPYILGILFIALSIWLIRRYYMRKYGRLQVAMADHNLDPPDVTAIRELEKLRREAPWRHSPIKSYYIRLSEVLRYYVEQVFHVPALEQTTSEILQSLGRHAGGKECLGTLDQILTLADLVKFARVVPDIRESEKQIDLAIDYIKKSRFVLPGNDRVGTEGNQAKTRQPIGDQNDVSQKNGEGAAPQGVGIGEGGEVAVATKEKLKT